jgi:hypothetical protein
LGAEEEVLVVYAEGCVATVEDIHAVGNRADESLIGPAVSVLALGPTTIIKSLLVPTPQPAGYGLLYSGKEPSVFECMACARIYSAKCRAYLWRAGSSLSQ